jgi:ABC-type amino acid transport system permease subunit
VIALAVTVLAVQYTSILTLQCAISTVNTRPMRRTRTRAVIWVQQTVCTLADTLVAALASPALLTNTLTVDGIECTESSTWVASVIEGQFAHTALGAEPWQGALLTRASRRIKSTAVLAVLRAHLTAVKSVIG